MPHASFDLEAVLREVGDYYAAKLAEHGAVPRGVDWNGEESQHLRFVQLERILDRARGDRSLSVLDVGCGYGAMLSFLRARGHECRYTGFDISPQMIDSARDAHRGARQARFTSDWGEVDEADYAVASGVFNVRGDRGDREWSRYVRHQLSLIDAHARRGWSVNLLSTYSDADKRRDHLYYADPGVAFAWCKRTFSRHVAVLHDYGLYEFTLLVRKDLDGWDRIPE